MQDNRKYYGQECQDDELNKKFRDLHHALVDLVISFCKENDIDIDRASLNIDGISASIPYGQWEACTDSGLTFYNYNKEEPFIYSM